MPSLKPFLKAVWKKKGNSYPYILRNSLSCFVLLQLYIIYHYLYARLGWSITKRKNANYIPQYAHLITKIALVRTNRYWTSAF